MDKLFAMFDDISSFALVKAGLIWY